MLYKRMLNEKKYVLFFLIYLVLSGCSDKPISLDDILSVGDDI